MSGTGVRRFLFPVSLALNAFLAVVLVMLLTNDRPPLPPAVAGGDGRAHGRGPVGR